MRKLVFILVALSPIAANTGCKPTVSGQTLNELSNDKEIVYIDQPLDEVLTPTGPGNALYDETQRLKAARKTAIEKQQTPGQ